MTVANDCRMQIALKIAMLRFSDLVCANTLTDLLVVSDTLKSNQRNIARNSSIYTLFQRYCIPLDIFRNVFWDSLQCTKSTVVCFSSKECKRKWYEMQEDLSLCAVHIFFVTARISWLMHFYYPPWLFSLDLIVFFNSLSRNVAGNYLIAIDNSYWQIAAYSSQFNNKATLMTQ